MKNILSTIFLIAIAHVASAQMLDSIFFNLYTDSLKRGTYNYINVEGRFTDGTYLPLSDKELKFSASGGKFARNSLFVDSSFDGTNITIKASVIRNPKLAKEIVVYIKTAPDNERLPTMHEVMNGNKGDTAVARKRKRK